LQNENVKGDMKFHAGMFKLSYMSHRNIGHGERTTKRNAVMPCEFGLSNAFELHFSALVKRIFQDMKDITVCEYDAFSSWFIILSPVGVIIDCI
jgi:hypothetical protein